MKITINKVIKTLIATDFIILSAFGLTAPIFAIFITEQITGGDVKVVGFAAAIYWIVKSVIQIPIGIFLDKRKGEKDDFWALFLGYFVAGLAVFGYIFSYLPWHIYLIQMLSAIGMALALPSWAAIFTRHIDKDQEAFEWSLESTGIGIAAGISGAIGGILVSEFGFHTVFILVGVFSCLSSFLLFFLRKEIFLKAEKGIYMPKIKKLF